MWRSEPGLTTDVHSTAAAEGRIRLFVWCVVARLIVVLSWWRQKAIVPLAKRTACCAPVQSADSAFRVGLDLAPCAGRIGMPGRLFVWNAASALSEVPPK